MFLRKKAKSPEDFWREYEENTGEKVLTRCLGQYVSGWEEFGKISKIWGLIIASSGGFRFHHFPQISWLDLISRSTGYEQPKEKTIFIPRERIINAQFIEEPNWWKKLVSPALPQLLINYLDETGNELQLLFEADTKAGAFKSEDFIANLLKKSTTPPRRDGVCCS
jgi:hypothetical protein